MQWTQPAGFRPVVQNRQSGVTAPAATRFGNTSPVFPGLTPVPDYATPIAGGNQYLRLYTTQVPGVPYPWFFAHRENAKAAVHAITIIKDAAGQEFIHLLVQKAPPLGGKPIVQLPAGLWGDNNPEESALKAANREVREETGYTVTSSKLAANQLFATSPGMTTEMKAIAVTHAEGEPSDEHQEVQEKVSIIARLDVPIETFRDYDKFMGWLGKMHQDGYLVGMDVLAARALLPPDTKKETTLALNA